MPSLRDELLDRILGPGVTREPPVTRRRRSLPVPLPSGRDSYILLSGGGAKGCFQAGALAFLGEYRFKPKLVCGTSVGSINAALPAARGAAGVRGLVDIWLSLRMETDMYVLSPAGRRFGNLFVSKITGFELEDLAALAVSAPLGIPDELRPDTRSERTRRRRRRRVKRFFGTLAAVGALPHAAAISSTLPAALGIAGVSVLQGIKVLEAARSIYRLTPIDRRIEAELTDEVLGSWQNPCRFTYLAAENGSFGWVNERGRVYEVDPRPRDRHHVFWRPSFDASVDASPAGLRKVLKAAILGSAAIPVAFEPQVIRTTDRRGWWVNRPEREVPPLEASAIGQVRTALDAGVSDVLPARAAKLDIRASIARGRETRVISISNSAVLGRKVPEVIGEVDDASPPKDWTRASGRYGTNILDIMTESVGLLKSEVSRTDLLELAEFGDDIDHTVIAPKFGINSTAQIDPGLIRIQLAYGWMTAHDEIHRELLDRWYPTYTRTTQLITRLRMNAWRHELRHQAGNRRRLTWSAGALELIREIKAAIHREVELRRTADATLREYTGFRNDSFPRLGDAAGSIDSWSTGFELHQHGRRDTRDLLRGRDPWQEYDDDEGEVVPAVDPPWT